MKKLVYLWFKDIFLVNTSDIPIKNFDNSDLAFMTWDFP